MHVDGQTCALTPQLQVEKDIELNYAALKRCWPLMYIVRPCAHEVYMDAMSKSDKLEQNTY